MQNDATKRLKDFTMANKQTQGKFTIGDEKVRPPSSSTHITFAQILALPAY